jgi:Glycosyl hydrolases family 35
LPGPYINAETAFGGLLGWTARLKAIFRSDDPEWLNATKNYVSAIGKAIANAEISKGGPIVLVQPENEYSSFAGVTNQMNKHYMAEVEEMFRDAVSRSRS